MYIFAKYTVYFTTIVQVTVTVGQIGKMHLSIFTPLKELYKSSSALSAHSQHTFINIRYHFKR